MRGRTLPGEKACSLPNWKNHTSCQLVQRALGPSPAETRTALKGESSKEQGQPSCLWGSRQVVSEKAQSNNEHCRWWSTLECNDKTHHQLQLHPTLFVYVPTWFWGEKNQESIDFIAEIYNYPRGEIPIFLSFFFFFFFLFVFLGPHLQHMEVPRLGF